MSLMERKRRTHTRTALVVASLVLFMAGPDLMGAEPGRGGESPLDSGRGKSILLSLKISRAKKKPNRVTLYKSVARQRKALPIGAPSPPAVR